MLRLIQFFVVIVAGLCAILGAILLASGLFANMAGDIALGTALIAGPVIVLLIVRHLAIRQGKAGFELGLQGFAPDHSAWYKGSGLAISSARRQILVAGPTQHRIYAFEDYAGSWGKFTTDVPYGGDGLIAVFTMLLALGRITLAYFTDGLFVNFRDGSSWRMIGVRRKDAERWADLLHATEGSIGTGR